LSACATAGDVEFKELPCVVVVDETTFVTVGELPPQPETIRENAASPATATVDSTHLTSVVLPQ
jgi:hypothetical protein